MEVIKIRKERIQLSFTEEELWIYEYICTKSSKNGWIKDTLAPAILKEKALNGSLHTLPEEIIQKYGIF